MPEPYEFYTPEAVARIDRIAAQAESLLPQLTGDERARVESQLALWRKARDVVEQSRRDAQSELEEPNAT